MAEAEIKTPEYVSNILQRNQKLWERELNDKPGFTKELEDWVAELTSRFSKLRGDKRKKPVVSIVIPAHNEEAHLLATLESLSVQKTDKTLEVIIVANNCNPEDRTYKIAKNCGVLAVQYKLKDDSIKPISYARQQGLEKAEGAIVVSTDADVVVMPYWIQRLAAPLLDDTSVGFTTSHSYLYHIEKNEQIRKSDTKRRFIREFFAWTGLIGLGNNMAFRRKDAIRLGGYNMSIYPGEDTEIGFRLTMFQQKAPKFIKAHSSAVWMSPRRVEAFGDDWLFSHMDWEGKILNARENFHKIR